MFKELKTVRQMANAGDVEGLKAMRRKYAKQAGFTLLELLIVVAILAAIAGTATIALQDTDARASAAAHVAMMDELNKGIRTYRVLNKNALPSNFDSLIQTSALDGSTDAALLSVAAIDEENLMFGALPKEVAKIMQAGGINGLRYVSTALGECAAVNSGGKGGIAEAITSRGNAVVAGNIFMSPEANGCGYGVKWENSDGEFVGESYPEDSAPNIAIWIGGYERVMGEAGAQFDEDKTSAPVLMAVGLGPSSTLFNANELGGLTSVPVYRHVTSSEYNRFVALFNVGKAKFTTAESGKTTLEDFKAGDQVWLTAIVDGAGDTKEEELGEWDGTRNTI